MKTLPVVVCLPWAVLPVVGCGDVETADQTTPSRSSAPTASASGSSPATAQPTKGSTASSGGPDSPTTSTETGPPTPNGGGLGDIVIGASFAGVIDFGVVAISNIKTRTLRVTRAFGEPVSITEVRVEDASGDFTLVPGKDTCTGISLTFGEECSFDVEFRPAVAGEHTGSAVVRTETANWGRKLDGRTKATSPSKPPLTKPPLQMDTKPPLKLPPATKT